MTHCYHVSLVLLSIVSKRLLLLGCGEGVIMPSLHRFAVNWFPVSERSTLVAVIGGGTDLGTILALFLSPMILKVTGQWRNIFLVFGAFSTVWLVFYFRCVTSKPEQHPWISREEKDFITTTRGSDGNTNQKIPWRTFLTSRHLWVIYISHFSFNYSWYVLLGWLPTYIHDHLDLDLKENKLLAATPYICGYFGLLIGGKVSDLLIARGFRTLHVRRAMNSIGSFGPAVCLYLLRFANNPATAVLLLSGSLFTGRCSQSGFWINMIDVGPDYADKTMGISNTIATVPGIFGNIITGYVLKQTDSWNMVFDIAAVVSIFGGVVFAFFSTDTNVFTRRPDMEMQAILD